VPQAIHVEKSVSAQIYDPSFLWLYATACFLFLFGGFYLGKNRRAQKLRKPMLEFNSTRLTIAAGGLVIIGIVALNLTVRTVESQQLGSSWTGIATAYYLLSQTSYYGLAIAALMFARRPSVPLAIIIVVAVIGILPAVLTLVKRNVLFELCVIAAGSLFFMRRYVPPRPLVFAAMIFGTIMIHQVGEIRNYIRDDRGSAIDAMMEGVLWENFAYFDMERAHEVTQASVDVYVARQSGDMEWGAEYWNKFVHQYVPAFLVGRDTKEGLKIDVRRGSSEVAVEDYFSHGATRTGFSDSFRSFQLFGVLVFGLIGYVMGRLYSLAITGSLVGQFLYVVLLNDALFAITESTARFISQLPFIAVITVGVIIFSRHVPPGKRAHLRVKIPSASSPRPAQG
ncbi:MAG: hypothetical protein AAGA69_10385, partial [Pseudomonadota bacterium]